MGSGKTTAGNLLASKLGLTFIDTDAVIEEEEGLPIAELFRVKGEPYFRTREKHVLRRLTEEHLSSGFVMSTGGGMPCDPENLGLMLKHGTVVYLKAGVDEILCRIKDTSERPVFHRLGRQEKPKEAVHALLEEREKYYSMADIVVTMHSSRTVAEVVREIERALEG